MRAYDSWKLVQSQRGRATVTGFNANRKSDLGVVYLYFLTLGRVLPRRCRHDRYRPPSRVTAMLLFNVVCIGVKIPIVGPRCPLAA